MGKRFESEHPGVRIDVQSGGSSRGISDARQGVADIGMVSRAFKPEQKDLKAFSIARDGVMMILHNVISTVVTCCCPRFGSGYWSSDRGDCGINFY
ncbi:substrate-binding domain-containing protein [Fischerella major]|nr:substrate-binding domain-containing protein [Fischerella major]